MNDLQRALSDALLAFVVDRRLAGHPLTPRERAYFILIALELGVLKGTPP